MSPPVESPRAFLLARQLSLQPWPGTLVTRSQLEIKGLAQTSQRVDAHVLATERARRVDALSEKLARHLPPADWQALFHGGCTQGIGFERKPLALLFAEAGEQRFWNDRERDTFTSWIERHVMETTDFDGFKRSLEQAGANV